MAQFNDDERQRIASAVGRVEGTPHLDENTVEVPRSTSPAVVQFRRFELKDDLTDDDTDADAYLLTRAPLSPSNSTQELRVRTHLVFKLWSFNGWTGKGRDASDPDNIVNGTRGLCVHLPDVNRWEVVSGDEGSKVCILSNSTYDVQPFGVVTSAGVGGISGDITFESRSSHSTTAENIYAANGPSTLAKGSDESSRGFIIGDTPVQVSVIEALMPSTEVGDAVGPIEFSSSDDPEYKYSCGLGLPPFTLASGSLYTDDDGGKYTLVNRMPAKNYWWCKAYADWVNAGAGATDYVYVNPCFNKDGDYCYDGTGGFPSILFQVALPHPAHKSPNVHEDDVFRYTFPSSRDTGELGSVRWIAVGPEYIDDLIGTVKMWKGAVADIPPGWQVYPALDGKFPLGDNSGVLGSGSFGTTGTDYNYAEIRFIERVA